MSYSGEESSDCCWVCFVELEDWHAVSVKSMAKRMGSAKMIAQIAGLSRRWSAIAGLFGVVGTLLGDAWFCVSLFMHDFISHAESSSVRVSVIGLGMSLCGYVVGY